MRGIRGDMDRLPAKGLAEINNERVQIDHKGVRNGVTGDGHGISTEGESRANEDAIEQCRELVPASAIVLHAQQQQSQGPQVPPGPVVRWERFLPFRTLKVLLVENDDSTRHVVSALLRNCSYEVTPASNSLEAWKILEDLNNHVDLVLTEVVMPYVSGIGLLAKIMNHKSFKNIPVIMMSSNDSMGIVFKCLSKGAVDFLVKPIRKNELKNLWQHVWRKCHSSSGSGSESGIRTQKYTRSKSVEGSEKNSDSNDEEENGSTGVNYRDGSDNGSGTQSSWSKRPVEVDSPQPMSPWDVSADPPDSTCAHVIHSRPETQSTNWVPTKATRKSGREYDETDTIAMGKDLTIGVPRNQESQLKGSGDKVLGRIVSNEKTKFLDPSIKKVKEKLENELSQYNNATAKVESHDKDNGLTGAITTISIPQGGTAQHEVANNPCKITNIKNMDIYGEKELPSLELSLKQLRDVSNTGGITAQEHNILRHSDHSAFSRYNTTSTANQAPTGNVGSCSPVDNSSEAMQNLQTNSSGTPNQGSNGSSNNNDMGSTTNNAFPKPEIFTEKQIPRSAVNMRPNSAFQQMQHGNNHSPPIMQPGKPDTSKPTSAQERGGQQQGQVEHHHHHHYHHHHHHVHGSKQKQKLMNSDDLSLRKMISTAPKCEPSNMLAMQIEGNAANYGSASGSNNGSNGQNGSSGQNGSNNGLNAEGTNIASENGATATNGAGSGSGVDEDRFAQQKEQREIALDKFRKKRKERCFEKKVRYQSRKKLAEQRPRVRGQFVKQAVDENKSKDPNP